MLFKEYLTNKNVTFFILVLIILFSLPKITVIALLFFASFVIACSLNPIVDKLEKKMKRATAASLVLFGVLVLSFAFFLPILFIAAKQIQGLLTILPTKIDLIQNFIFNHQFYGYKIPEMINLDAIIKTSSPFATGLVNQSINFTLNFAQSILFFLIICMVVFYFLADKSEIKTGFIRLFPGEIKLKASEMYDNISEKVGGYVIAQILNMAAVGILTGLGLLLIRVDYSFLLGLVTGVLDIIPIIGPTISLILCLIMANQMGFWGLVLVVVVFLAAQWIANNLIKPVVFGKFLNLHPLIIIFALLVAADFLGVWGVILAPAIASLVCVLFDEIYLKTINKINGDE